MKSKFRVGAGIDQSCIACWIGYSLVTSSQCGSSIASQDRSRTSCSLWIGSTRPALASRSLTESIDSTTASGRMMMQMLGAIAEFERAMVRERTQAGLLDQHVLRAVAADENRASRLSRRRRF